MKKNEKRMEIECNFMAIFFIAMGMFVNLEVLAQNWPVLLGLTLLVVLVKFSAGSLAASEQFSTVPHHDQG